jgi:hypothetical protein
MKDDLQLALTAARAAADALKIRFGTTLDIRHKGEAVDH